ncbi:hypothetical protein V8F20_012867, partial [Naviculisporaceae sp. PSN 640]
LISIFNKGAVLLDPLCFCNFVELLVSVFNYSGVIGGWAKTLINLIYIYAIEFIGILGAVFLSPLCFFDFMKTSYMYTFTIGIRGEGIRSEGIKGEKIGGEGIGGEGFNEFNSSYNAICFFMDY